MAQINSILLVDKPSGPTSHDIVNMVRRWSGQRRVGHAGTLDPAATGLLVLLLGKATRLSSWVMGADKTYEGAVRFGIATDTLDADGSEVGREPCVFSSAELRLAVDGLTGEITQVPPQYSAVKVAGSPAYKTARAGGELELSERQVRIDSFEVGEIVPGDFPSVTFRVECSSGTYIRSLAADLGTALGCFAHLESLRRTRVGRFTLDGGVTVDELRGLPWEEVPLVSMKDALDLPEHRASLEELPLLLTGRAVLGAGEAASLDEGAVVKIIADDDGELLGLGRIKEGKLKPFVVVRET